MTATSTRDDDVILALANVESAYGPIKAIRGVSLKVRAARSSPCSAPTAPARPPS